MKYTIYRCDYCEQVLSDEISGIFKPHISVNIGSGSGYYEKNNENDEKNIDGWQRSLSFKNGIYQYCDKYCLGLGLIEQKKITDNV